MKRVLFRTGGSQQTGYGHVRRCLTLANALHAHGATCAFLLDGEAAISAEVKRAGFEAHLRHAQNDAEQTLALAPQFVIADSYALTTDYFRALHTAEQPLAVIDDLADRELPVNLIINGAVSAQNLAYRALPTTRYLLGPHYILLRPEFAQAPERVIAPVVQRIMITVGGSDPHNLTPRLMRWARDVLPTVALDVVIGPLFTNQRHITETAQELASEINLHPNPPAMRPLMLAADLAITGGGQTTYELAATGTPTLAVLIAENQTVNLTGFAEAQALHWVGRADEANLADKLRAQLQKSAACPTDRAQLSQRGRALVDGQGAERVAQVILQG